MGAAVQTAVDELTGISTYTITATTGGAQRLLMKKFRILAVLAIAGLSFAAGAYCHKWLFVIDKCYDAGGIINDRGFCVGYRE